VIDSGRELFRLRATRFDARGRDGISRRQHVRRHVVQHAGQGPREAYAARWSCMIDEPAAGELASSWTWTCPPEASVALSISTTVLPTCNRVRCGHPCP